MPRTTATERETRIYRYICEYKSSHDGCAPATRQIMSECNIPSTSLVWHYLNKLEERGLVRLTGDGVARHILVNGGRWTPPKGV